MVRSEETEIKGGAKEVMVNGKEKKCGCEIEIEDSVVIIICGDFDLDKLGNCIKTIAEPKVNKSLVRDE